MTRYVSRWGEQGSRPVPADATRDLFARFEVRVSVDVHCPAEAAWALVTDIARIGEFSPECVEARWLDDVAAPTRGARFEGTNRVADGGDEFIWIRPCTVTEVEPGRRFSYVVGDRFDGTPASHWQLDIESLDPSRCRITQTFRHDPDGISGVRSAVDAEPDRAGDILRSRSESLSAGMTTTLFAMKGLLEGAARM